MIVLHCIPLYKKGKAGYNIGITRFAVLWALYLFTSYGAQVRGLSYALTVKRRTVCGRQNMAYSFLWASAKALTSKRLLVTGLYRAV